MWDISCALIIPASYRAEMNSIGEAVGYGPNSLSVPLSADGSEPATHYACHTWCNQVFLDMLANPPAEFSGSPALANLAVHYVQGGNPTETFSTALQNAGLVRVGDTL